MTIKKKVVITSGDPAGCGPDITIRAIQEFGARKADFYLVGDHKVFEAFPAYQEIKKQIKFVDLNTPGIEKMKKATGSALSGKAALSYLDCALGIAKKKNIKRLVTAPLSKEAVQLNQPKFSGHTEYLSNYFGSSQVAMMMVSKEIKIVLLTRHLNLGKVSRAITPALVKNTLNLVYRSLRKQFKIKNPRIVFASFNPHAGLNTFLGNEEKVIFRAIKHLKIKAEGPYPADTLFIKNNLNRYDCFICAYHDQAMIPFKLLAMPDGVNFTLGLPVVRTSPAHGVAFDILRRQKAPFHSSMLAAINLAVHLNPRL